jgi:hypothetical protein
MGHVSNEASSLNRYLPTRNSQPGGSFPLDEIDRMEHIGRTLTQKLGTTLLGSWELGVGS